MIGPCPSRLPATSRLTSPEGPRPPWRGAKRSDLTMRTQPDTGRAAWEEDVTNPRVAIAHNAKLPTGDGSVRCLVCGLELQYITHSHVVTHPNGPNSIEEYKETVAGVLDVEEDEVPVMSADLSDELADRTQQAWDEGKYDHFRLPE